MEMVGRKEIDDDKLETEIFNTLSVCMRDKKQTELTGFSKDIRIFVTLLDL